MLNKVPYSRRSFLHERVTVIVECSVPHCDFQIPAIALLTNHGLAHQNTAPAESPQPAPTLQGPKLERPKVDVFVSIEDWNVFVRRWEVFRTGSGINQTSALTSYSSVLGPSWVTGC